MSASPVRPFEDDYLQSYSREHVSYEFDMFLWSADLSASPTLLAAPNPVEARRLNNGLIELFVLHLRNVLDFFFPKNPRPTDVIAADFCADGTWHSTISPSLNVARARAHKEVAHLTTGRISGAPAQKGWDFAGLAAEMRPIMELFISLADPSRLAAEVRTVVESRKKSA